ncbi:MAG: hypothetical protein IPN17_11240 [Deltaproteobacteria bacterium]|nr:hypothetical protein [Deltaproteobacteria bacterium]
MNDGENRFNRGSSGPSTPPSTGSILLEGSPPREDWTWLSGPDGLTAARCSIAPPAP